MTELPRTELPSRPRLVAQFIIGLITGPLAWSLWNNTVVELPPPLRWLALAVAVLAWITCILAGGLFIRVSQIKAAQDEPGPGEESSDPFKRWEQDW